MSVSLSVEENEVSGELSLPIAPGTTAKVIEELLSRALGDALHEKADELGVVLGAHPSRYAKPLPGKDEAGNTRYAIRARKEGGRLVPAHRPTPRSAR